MRREPGGNQEGGSRIRIIPEKKLKILVQRWKRGRRTERETWSKKETENK